MPMTDYLYCQQSKKMLKSWTYLLLLLVSLLNFNASAASLPGAVFKRTTTHVSCQTFEPKCTGINFFSHMDRENIMRYTMNLLSVSWLGDNLYEVEIHVVGAEQIDLKYLWSLKIIGVNGPSGTVQLYGTNENTYLISNPTDFTAKFQVYGSPSQSDSCIVELSSFQIQFEYIQGSAADYSSTWKWGKSSFDLMTGCNADDQGNSNADFPIWQWNKDCGTCGGSSSTSSSSSSSSPTSSSSSRTSTPSTTTTRRQISS